MFDRYYEFLILLLPDIHYIRDSVCIIALLALPLVSSLSAFLASYRRRNAIMLSCSLLVLLVWMMVCYAKFFLHIDNSLQLAFIGNFTIHLRITNLGLLFCGVIATLYPIALLYTINYFKVNKLKYQASFYVFFNLVIFAGIGVSLSGNLLTMFMFYELITLTTYPIIVANYNDVARIASRYYLGVLLSSSTMLLLPAVMYTGTLSGNLEFMTDGVFGHVQLSDMQLNILLLMFVFGIAKTAILPLHTWILHAMIAPVPVSSILHAVVVVKSGLFMLINVVFHVFGTTLLKKQIWCLFGCNWLFWLAAFTTLYTGIRACYSSQIKQRLAYSTIAQLAYGTLSVSLFSYSGKVAAMAQIIAHAFAKISLFFGAGAIYSVTGKSAIASMSGIFFQMKGTVLHMAIAAASLIGLPFTIGFHSKHYMIHGILGSDTAVIYWIVLVMATILAALYMIPMIYTFCTGHANMVAYSGKTLPIMMPFSMLLCSIVIVVTFCFDDIISSIL